jgi:hypothetical protein
MGGFRRVLIGTVCLTATAWLVGCKRAPESSSPGPAGAAGASVAEDLKGIGKASEKAAKDIGHATVDLADKAGKGLEDATDKAGVKGQDTWITTKVKSELTSAGFDPLHVHVDTDGKVVTLSGTVESSLKREKAVSAAKGVAGVLDVKNHLVVSPSQR